MNEWKKPDFKKLLDPLRQVSKGLGEIIDKEEKAIERRITAMAEAAKGSDK